MIFDYEEQSTSLEIFINNIEFEELDSKFLEVKESTIKVPFLMINIFPTNDGIIHNDTIGPTSFYGPLTNPLLELTKSKIKNILITTKNAIELGSAFRDYGQNTAKSYISLETKAYINIYVDIDNYKEMLFDYDANNRIYDYEKIFSTLLHV